MTDQNQSSSQPGQDWRPQQTQPKLPLGVGTIIAQSFSILFRNFFKVILVGFVPSFLGYLAPVLILSLFGTLSWPQQLETQPEDAAIGISIAVVVMGLLQAAVFAFIAALLAQLAYDAKLSRPVRLRRYLGPALSAVPSIVVLAIAVVLILFLSTFPLGLMGAALGPVSVVIVLTIPFVSLWIMAVFSVTAPAVVIERVGLKGLNRSAFLTKQYRWPIVGTLFLTLLCFVGVYSVLGVATVIVMSGFSLFDMQGGAATLLISTVPIILYIAMSTLGLGLMGIVIALIYARLREIKEGISVDQIAAVFE